MAYNITKLLSLVSLLLCLSFCTIGVVHARPPFACDPHNPITRGLKFCRVTVPIHVRVQDLIGRLTLQEKIRLLVNNAIAVPRLGIQGYEWWSEALHGVSNVGPGTKFGGAFPGATSFPQVITTAASFNESLWQEIGRVVSDEARAMYNGGMAGLTYWSPNVNIFRDPRWGRGQETPGEDPVLAAKYAARYVKGLQGDGAGNRLKVAACCKHYTAYDLDNWNGVNRFHFNARVSKQDLVDTYDVPFKACVVEGNVASVMCSYNQVNGKPTCADPDLLKGTIRGQWRLNGYIVSDCDSVGVLYDEQHYTRTPEEAAADAIKAGLDLDCGPFLAIHTEAAVRRGLVSQLEINWALANTMTVQMRLGMFDGEPSAHQYGNLGPRDVCTPAHQQLALEAARQGIVLLENRGRSLPLSTRRHRTVAVIGPNSDVTVTMIGNYAGVACGYTTPLQGIGRYTRTIHQAGCTDVHCNGNQLFGAAEAAARQADATVLVMGLDQSIEAEFVDRAGLLLPGHQQELVSRVARASRGPTILVLMSGGPIDVTFAKNDPRISAIIWVGYPGQAGGTAIADVLFGTTNPGGKLPMTWYPQNYVTHLPMTDMAMRADPARGYPGRTYRFYRGPVVFPFGLGLSYTTFAHNLAHGPTLVSVPLTSLKATSNSTMLSKAVRVSHADCNALSPLDVHVDVKNTGSMDGTHTLLVFTSPPDGKWAASKQLVGFHKIHIAVKIITAMKTTEEPDVGIFCYISQLPGFRGILKQRYSDFMVNEVDTEGNVVHLTNLDAPAETVKEIETKTHDVTSKDYTTEIESFRSLVDPDDVERLEAIINQINSGSEDSILPIVLSPDYDKSHRTAVHNFFKENFKFLVTDTVDGPDASSKCIRVRINSGGQNSRGRNSRKRKERGDKPFDSRGSDDWSENVGKFLRFHLYKENKDTQEALGIIAKMLGIQPRSFGFAGTKDKRAVTTQRVTVFKQLASRLAALNDRLIGIKVGDFCCVKEGLVLGQLLGNRFTITLRGVVADSEDTIKASAIALGKQGFINYFGLQRFGSGSVPTHLIGATLLRGEWKSTVSLFLDPREGEKNAITEAREYYKETNDIEGTLRQLPRHLVSEKAILQCLKKCPGNYLQALKAIPRTLRMMYVHSYQSYLWNHAASMRVQKYGTDRVVLGDLVYCKGNETEKVSEVVSSKCVDENGNDTLDPNDLDDISGTNLPEESLNLVKAVTAEDILSGNYTIDDVVLPMPGSRVIFPENDIAHVFHDLAKKDAISLTESVHNVKEFSITSMTGSYRRVFQKPMDFEWEILKYIDGNKPLVDTDFDKIAKTKPSSLNEDGRLHDKTKQSECLDNDIGLQTDDNGAKAKGEELPQAESLCDTNPQETQTALKLSFTLPASCYATMAIRELLKTSTSVAFHKTLN